jgi:WhiB family redox-sensing transcriptional regulator
MERFIDPGSEWLDRKNCHNTQMDLFDPICDEDVKAAKAICRDCEVRQECLAYAITHRERRGVWGGMSERDRRALAKVNARLGSIACIDYLSGRPHGGVTSDSDE